MARSGKRGGGERAGNPPKTRQNRRRRPESGASAAGLTLYGIHTVTAALENPKRRIRAIKGTKNALTRLQLALANHQSTVANPSQMLKQAPEIVIETVETQAIDKMVGSEVVHQGIVAICDPLTMIDGSELFVLAEARLLLALDQITDPHNVGAILRSAVAMGVDAVLMTHRNSAIETAVLAKTASGALDMIDIVDVRNLSKAITELGKMGFATIGLDSEGPDVIETELQKNVGRPVVLVLGSEGRGLREQTREACSALARLDMPGAIKSLNVSNAAALSLYLATKAVEPKS